MSGRAAYREPRVAAATLAYDELPSRETRVVTPDFRGDAGPTLFPGAEHIDFTGPRAHLRAPLHALRMQRSARLDGDVVLALHSSGWALGAQAPPGVPVVAFTNGPPRWMGPQMPFYVRVAASRLSTGRVT